MDVVKINDLDTIALSDDLLMLLEKTSETIGKKATIADLLTYVVNSNALSEKIASKLDTNDLLGKIYPTGSIYISVNNVSPASFIGGTWEALKDRFLIGAGGSYAINATGGATEHSHTTGGHTLTVNEIPSHSHGMQSAGAHTHTVKYSVYEDEGRSYQNFSSGSNNGAISQFNTESAGAHTHTINNTGGGASHSHGNTGSANNLPPYLAVYMWKRTA